MCVTLRHDMGTLFGYRGRSRTNSFRQGLGRPTWDDYRRRIYNNKYTFIGLIGLNVVAATMSVANAVIGSPVISTRVRAFVVFPTAYTPACNIIRGEDTFFSFISSSLFLRYYIFDFDDIYIHVSFRFRQCSKSLLSTVGQTASRSMNVAYAMYCRQVMASTFIAWFRKFREWGGFDISGITFFLFDIVAALITHITYLRMNEQ